MNEQEVDILIIGGGLIGAALLLALAKSNYKVLLVEARPLGDLAKPDFDARSLALSPATVRILTMLSVWPLLKEKACPIKTIQVTDQHHFGTARLNAEPDEALGWVLELYYINQALQELVPREQMMAPAKLVAVDAGQGVATLEADGQTRVVKAKLIVAADGTDSTVRRLCGVKAKYQAYGQQALVANIGLGRSHQYQAFERFTLEGPLAMLPLSDKRMALVWAASPARVAELLALEEAAFLKTLQANFGYRQGRLLKVGRRTSFPVQKVVSESLVKDRVVFVGNAAQTLHPVAGQGFNLGLRDVAMLAQLIMQQGLGEQMLHYYQQSRNHDKQSITGLTDSLIKVFTSNFPGLSIARSLGLMALDNSTALKNILARYARGFGGIVPDLVCQIPLSEQSQEV